jgi:enamine deaminase RidA (YjgF/YER057c/UK114 family)
MLRAHQIYVIPIAFLALTSAFAADTFPMRIPASGGEVILPDEGAKRAHDEFHYAAARRVDNTLYISGVIVYRRENEGRDIPAFKLQVRRTFERLQTILRASGAGFEDVAMINSFHVWQGPNFTGTRDEQFTAFSQVASEFIKTPYPAWTAVGTTGLLGDGGIVEVQLIARVPPGQK